MNVLCFGIAKDLVGKSTIDVENIDSVLALRKYIDLKYPGFKELKRFMIAVNEEYAEDDQLIMSSDSVAIIPPVSGG